MDIHVIYAAVGFMLAAYSVIGNDSVQTLGTFIASNHEKVAWWKLWMAASAVLIFTVAWGWYANGGDISYGRLDKIPYQEIQWYHAAAPAVLVALTWVGVPVSTTFLVLSVFASTLVLEKMLVKSIIGYSLSAISAYVLWIVISRFMNEKFDAVEPKHRKAWRYFQWGSTGFLWYTWLTHDMANIAVYLPRELSLELLLVCIAVPVAFLGIIFRNHGGKIQKIILEKTGSRFIRSASIIDLVYAFVLLFFKQYNSIPMSTTWVFVGVLCGRELAIATTNKDYRLGYVFPLVGRDFLKMMIGLAVSVGLVLSIHYFLDPTNLNGEAG